MVAWELQGRFGFLPGVPLPLKSKIEETNGYLETPRTLGEHLKKRSRELGLLQQEAAEIMGVSADTALNWEKDKVRPAAAQFRLLAAILGYDPNTCAPYPRRTGWRPNSGAFGVSHAQVAKHLGWTRGVLGATSTWRLSPYRAGSVGSIPHAEVAILAGVHSLRRHSSEPPIHERSSLLSEVGTKC